MPEEAGRYSIFVDYVINFVQGKGSAGTASEGLDKITSSIKAQEVAVNKTLKDMGEKSGMAVKKSFEDSSKEVRKATEEIKKANKEIVSSVKRTAGDNKKALSAEVIARKKLKREYTLGKLTLQEYEKAVTKLGQTQSIQNKRTNLFAKALDGVRKLFTKTSKEAKILAAEITVSNKEIDAFINKTLATSTGAKKKEIQGLAELPAFRSGIEKVIREEKQAARARGELTEAEKEGIKVSEEAAKKENEKGAAIKGTREETDKAKKSTKNYGKETVSTTKKTNILTRAFTGLLRIIRKVRGAIFLLGAVMAALGSRMQSVKDIAGQTFAAIGAGFDGIIGVITGKLSVEDAITGVGAAFDIERKLQKIIKDRVKDQQRANEQQAKFLENEKKFLRDANLSLVERADLLNNQFKNEEKNLEKLIELQKREVAALGEKLANKEKSGETDDALFKKGVESAKELNRLESAHNELIKTKEERLKAIRAQQKQTLRDIRDLQKATINEINLAISSIQDINGDLIIDIFSPTTGEQGSEQGLELLNMIEKFKDNPAIVELKQQLEDSNQAIDDQIEDLSRYQTQLGLTDEEVKELTASLEKMKSLLANQSLNQQGEVAVGLENRSITGEGIEQREDIESGRGIRAVKDRKIATQRLRERQEQIEEELKLEKEGSDRYLELMEETNGIQREIIDQRVEDLKRAGRAAISFASDIFAHQQEQTEIQITAQKERVKDAEKLAEEGKTKQLQIEEERLQELQDKRENFVQAQRALAAIEIAIQQGRAAALSIAAISEAVAQPFPTNLLAVPLVLGLIAQIGSGALAVSSAFSAVPEFHEGTERTGRGDVDGKGGFLSVLHPNERVVPEKDNARIGYDFPNEKIPEAVALYKAYPRMAGSAMTVGGTNDFGDVTAELKELRTDIQAMKFFMNITEDGIEAVVQKRVDGINRIEKIRG